MPTSSAAAGLIAVMLGAITVGGHIDHGFLMNWFGSQAGEGFEFHLLVIALAGALLYAGGGAWSADSEISTRWASW